MEREIPLSVSSLSSRLGVAGIRGFSTAHTLAIRSRIPLLASKAPHPLVDPETSRFEDHALSAIPTRSVHRLDLVPALALESPFGSAPPFPQRLDLPALSGVAGGCGRALCVHKKRCPNHCHSQEAACKSHNPSQSECSSPLGCPFCICMHRCGRGKAK